VPDAANARKQQLCGPGSWYGCCIANVRAASAWQAAYARLLVAVKTATAKIRANTDEVTSDTTKAPTSIATDNPKNAPPVKNAANTGGKVFTLRPI
jgi:hypothetical protein